jgi:hypothetical protein
MFSEQRDPRLLEILTLLQTAFRNALPSVLTAKNAGKNGASQVGQQRDALEEGRTARRLTAVNTVLEKCLSRLASLAEVRAGDQTIIAALVDMVEGAVLNCSLLSGSGSGGEQSQTPVARSVSLLLQELAQRHSSAVVLQAVLKCAITLVKCAGKTPTPPAGLLELLCGLVAHLVQLFHTFFAGGVNAPGKDWDAEPEVVQLGMQLVVATGDNLPQCLALLPRACWQLILVELVTHGAVVQHRESGRAALRLVMSLGRWHHGGSSEGGTGTHHRAQLQLCATLDEILTSVFEQMPAGQALVQALLGSLMGGMPRCMLNDVVDAIWLLKMGFGHVFTAWLDAVLHAESSFRRDPKGLKAKAQARAALLPATLPTGAPVVMSMQKFKQILKRVCGGKEKQGQGKGRADNIVS